MPTAVITGANRGIGLELARQFSARGDTVIAVCRKSSPELASLDVRVESGIDVGQAIAAPELASRLHGTAIDILVNNAGIFLHEDLSDMNFERIEQQLEVNALGPLRVTKALLPRMKSGGKIAIVTSRMGSIADNGSGEYYGYRMSKAAVNAAGVSLARDLAGQGVAVALLHPGMVATEMTGRQGIPPADAARGLIERIDALTMETTGSFWHGQTGEILPW
jgi:NAD(P)-dependent dehydrogenase (short-subunit alcohol dehydrogenase family)